MFSTAAPFPPPKPHVSWHTPPGLGRAAKVHLQGSACPQESVLTASDKPPPVFSLALLLWPLQVFFTNAARFPARLSAGQESFTLTTGFTASLILSTVWLSFRSPREASGAADFQGRHLSRLSQGPASRIQPRSPLAASSADLRTRAHRDKA